MIGWWAETNLAPGAATITLTPGTPDSVISYLLAPQSAELAISGGTPIVGGDYTAQPAAAELAATTGEPDINVSITTNAATLELATGTPDVSVTDHKSLTPTNVNLSTTTGTPLLVVHTTLQPQATQLEIATGTPVADIIAPPEFVAAAGADGDNISTLEWDQDVADGGCILVGLAYRDGDSLLPSSVTCDDEPMSFVSLLNISATTRPMLVYAARGQSGGTKTIRVSWSSNVDDTAAGSVAYNGVVAPPHAVQTVSVASAGSLDHARTAEPGGLLVCFHAIVHGSTTANITSTGGGTQRFIRTGVRDAALAISDSEVATTFSMTSSLGNSAMGQTSLVLPGITPLPQFHSVGGSVVISATNPSFSVSPADEAYLIVIAHYYSTTARTLDSVTCNGQPLSLIGSMKPANKESHTLAVYGARINPGVGGPLRQVALSFSGSVGVAATAVVYTGVREVVWQSDSTAVANSIAHPASCGPRQRVVGILTASNDGSGEIGLATPPITGGTQRTVTGSPAWIRVAVADAVEDTVFTLTRNTSTACNMAAVSLLLKPY